MLNERPKYTPVTAILDLESGGKFQTQYGLVTNGEWIQNEQARLQRAGMLCKIVPEGGGHALVAATRPEIKRGPLENLPKAYLPVHVPLQRFGSKAVFRCVRCNSLYSHRVNYCSGRVKDEKGKIVGCCKGSMEFADLEVVRIATEGKTGF